MGTEAFLFGILWGQGDPSNKEGESLAKQDTRVLLETLGSRSSLFP